MRALVLLAILLAPAAALAEQPPLTHTSPLTPTGALVPRGQLERTQSLVAFHHELALGLADGLEVRLASPLIPVPVLGGDLQLRASVLPRDAEVELVLGAGAAVEWINGIDVYTTASVTAAWRGLHATVRGVDRQGTDDRVVLATAGAMRRAGARTLLFVEVGDLAWIRPGTCVDKHRAEVTCDVASGGHGLLAGAWWELDSMSIGLSAALIHAGGTTVPVLPLLSMRWLKDL